MTESHLTRAELEAGLATILESPRDRGVLELIVQRPADNERNVVATGTLSVEEGLVGDNWKARGSGMTADRSAHPDMQLNIMNARVAALVAQDPDRRALAGDQLYVDLDLSDENLPPGTQLRIGEAIVEVTAIPHTGCRKFVQRFGRDAMEFVNSERGRQLNLRGICARVVQPGEIKASDVVVVDRSGGKGLMRPHALTPILNVSNVRQSIEWFEKLGWAKAWDWGDPIGFACVCAGKCEIFLCLDGQGGRGKGTQAETFGAAVNEKQDAGVWMSIWVDKVDEIHEHCVEHGIEVTWKPADMPWGVREMHIRHPDGHVFRVSQGLERS